MSGSTLTHNFVIAPPSSPAIGPATVAPRRGRGQQKMHSFIAQAKEFWRRYRSRVAISGLDAHLLRDIGVTYAEAEQEANKPFWRL